MSGRLIILPHKKWNVWNRDNVEKVLKDERLDREAKEKDAKKQRLIENERRLQRLKEQAGIVQEKEEKSLNDLSSEYAAETVPLVQETVKRTEPLKHVHLFEEEEREHAEKALKGSNEQYMKDKERRERQKKKQMGVAELQMGEFSGEGKGSANIRPWYEYTPGDAPLKNNRGYYITNDREQHFFMKKEARRKHSDDPMTMIQKHFAPQDKYANKRHNRRNRQSLPNPPSMPELHAPVPLLSKLPTSTNGENSYPPASDSSTTTSHQYKEKPTRKRKRRHHRKHEDSDSDCNSNSHSESHQSRGHKRRKRHRRSETTHDEPSTDQIEIMRRQREEREREEAKREELIMSKMR
eukprot:TRINITY_DN5969_c0_g1_i1.p1 TRINITY_DN5969_c0_g1~~TRINITY_DN5969_c0_g1_i1.p1  ORF type:complete len:352 (-),score=100.02 TRINITY_DN5969_c0_g1_i1:66-1121(-)